MTPSITLRNGVVMPQLGFGVFQIEPEHTADAVIAALHAGYRHIDTAQGYKNEREVVEGIDRSGVDPGEVFVTSKVSNAHLTYEEAERSIDETLRALGGRIPDLFLVHWPLPTVRDYTIPWRALEAAYADGKAKAIGVANFQIEHLQRLTRETDTVPEVNQIELHPYLTQEELRTYGQQHGIATEAWSPLGQGLVLSDPVIQAIAAETGRTPAQVVIRWHLQVGNIVIPKSVTPSRIVENFQSLTFELTADQVSRIAARNRNERTGADPDTFRYRF